MVCLGLGVLQSITNCKGVKKKKNHMVKWTRIKGWGNGHIQATWAEPTSQNE